MPAFFCHYRFGYHAFRDMTAGAVRDSIRRHPHVFALGCQGPDLFFYNLASYSGEGMNYGNRLHEENTGLFLRMLAETSLRMDAGEERETAIAYTAGFLAHYCLDCNAHPFVYGMVGDHEGAYFTGRHFEFEADMDIRFLDQVDGRKPSDYDAAQIATLSRRERRVVAVQLARGVTRCLKGVHLTTSQCEKRLVEVVVLLRLMRDRSGWKGRTVGAVEKQLMGHQLMAPLFYNDLEHGSKDVCNESRQLWYNPFSDRLEDASFFDLMERAREEYLKIIAMYEDYLGGETGLGELAATIGNRSYKTGMDIS